MSNLNQEQNFPIPNSSTPVWDLVKIDIDERDKFGREKYGVSLQCFNGRDGLIDIYQELLDAVVYTRKEIEERRIMSEEYPDEYIPSELRERKDPEREQTVFACGYEVGEVSLAMFHGPNPDLKEMLEVIPEDSSRQACIVEFNKDGTDRVVYKWRKNRWKRCK